MAPGDIHRNGDSGDQAGTIMGAPESVRLHLDPVHLLAAVEDSAGKLKLISWRVTSNGPVDRVGDSGNQAGKTSRFSLAHVFSTFDHYVTAVMADGGEKLISWNVNAAGAITRMEDSGNDGMDAINGVSVVGRNEFHNVVTGIWDINKNLSLESWRMNQNGQFTLQNNSGNQAGEIQTPPTLIALDNGLVISAVVTKESTLKLISWRVEGDGSLNRLEDSGNLAGEVKSAPAAVAIFQNLIVTAVSDSDSNLKLISWQVSDDGSIARRGDSGSQAGGISFNPSISSNGSRIVTAVGTEEETLKLLSWEVTPDGTTIDRRGDSGSQAGTITADPSIDSSPHSSLGFVTSVRTAGDGLKLLSWTVEPF